MGLTFSRVWERMVRRKEVEEAGSILDGGKGTTMGQHWLGSWERFGSRCKSATETLVLNLRWPVILCVHLLQPHTLTLPVSFFDNDSSARRRCESLWSVLMLPERPPSFTS